MNVYSTDLKTADDVKTTTSLKTTIAFHAQNQSGFLKTQEPRNPRSGREDKDRQRYSEGWNSGKRW